ncbi:MAG: tetratricopeptide repeat protein, partial [Planctomycetes bacterium]|nr:tetratricopeptide repeat protein [Planctomycetota bacterium]
MARQFALWLVCVVAVGALALPAVGSEAETQRRVRFNRGIVAFGQGDYAGAERVFAELVRTDETDVAGRYWLGLCQLQQYEYAAATASFQKVLELSPENLDAKLDAAIALAGQNEYAHSRKLLREFIDAGEADAGTLRQAHFFLGVAEYKTGHNEAALASLEAAEQGATEPSMLANIAWFRGWIYTEQRQLEEAAAQFTRVSELASNVDQRARARTLAEQLRAGVTVEKEEPVSQFQFRLDMGLSYDTDVILLGDDTSLPVGLST